MNFKLFRLIAVFVAAILIGAVSARSAAAAVTVTLTPNIGPPTTMLQVSGAGFPVTTAVDIYFDTTDVALAVTNSTGAFSGITIQAPTSAVPGTHWVSAVARGTSGTAAQSSFTVQTNYTQFHYSQLHKGKNPYENVLSTTNVGSIDVDWSYATLGAITSSPAVSGGTLFVGSADDDLYAINATTGATVWKFHTTNSIVDSSPAVVNGIVYIGSTDGNLYAVSATTGLQESWSPMKTGAAINSSPAVVNGVVYIGSTDKSLYAFNATTGVKLWSTVATGNTILSSPAVYNGVVYVGSYDNSLYAYNAATGAKLWSYATGGKIFSSPAVSDNVVIVGSEDGSVYGLAAGSTTTTTATLIWKYTPTGTVSAFDSSPAVSNGVVCIASNAGVIYGLSAKSGGYIWELTATAGGPVGSPTWANGVAYVGVGNQAWAVASIVTAGLYWQGITNSLVTAAPTVVNGVVYVASQDKSVYAFDLNGSTQVKIPPPRPDPAGLKPDLGLAISWSR
jgi:outer membrane protein assembly factor BamB